MVRSTDSQNFKKKGSTSSRSAMSCSAAASAGTAAWPAALHTAATLQQKHFQASTAWAAAQRQSAVQYHRSAGQCQAMCRAMSSNVQGNVKQSRIWMLYCCAVRSEAPTWWELGKEARTSRAAAAGQSPTAAPRRWCVAHTARTPAHAAARRRRCPLPAPPPIQPPALW